MSQARPASSLSDIQEAAVDRYLEQLNAQGAGAGSVDSLRARSRQARAQLDALVSANGPLARETIFCGSDQPFTAADFYEIGLAPLSMSLGIDEAPTEQRAQKPRRSSGCGTQIHIAARPLPDHSWAGDSAGVSATVIPLDAKYVSAEAAVSTILPTRDACGCSCAFVGCAVCGNPLGMLLTPCTEHISDDFPRVYSFLPSAVSPPLPSSPLPHFSVPAFLPPPSQTLSTPNASPATGIDPAETPGPEPRPLRRRRRQPAAVSPLASAQAAAPRFPPPPPALQPLLGEHDPALEYHRVAISNGLALLNDLSTHADAATRELGVLHTAIRERGGGIAGARPGGILPEGATTRVLRVGARNADQTGVDTAARLVFGETAQDRQPTLADSIARLRGMIPGLSREPDQARLPAPVQPGVAVVLPAVATRPLRANAPDPAQPEAEGLADAQPRAFDARDP
ncbi:hypothetical protein B0H17DRAFT_1177710 [Mycena rosella]|uniref:Uncharacterized protein n=1 Tax=Mycena rosella TaxID=1033263 RepID=A0AAD7GJ66_MYCRO|nr:hypothetical protein B0H17DRAFT_1177710 [Mycena rosella]